MTRRIFSSMRWTRKPLLAGLAAAAVAVLVLSAMVSAPQLYAQSEQTAPALTYDVVSIKPVKGLRQVGGMRSTPDGLMLMGVALSTVIAGAYHVRLDRISGMPAWLTSDPYDLQAKMGDATLAAFQKLPDKEQRLERFRMLQPVLEDRLKLKVHRETKIVRTYDLVIAKGGFKLKEADPNNTYENGIKGPDGSPRTGVMSLQGGKLRAQAITIARLAGQLSLMVDGPVTDKTGLTGQYDITLEWAPNINTAPSEESGPSIFTAVQEQLGLKLEPTKGPVDALVIDHVEKPTEN